MQMREQEGTKEMKKSVNLLEGSIFPSLTKLALPIMATSLVQMAYNMTDMIWIGRISSDAVAAVGAAGMYMMARQWACNTCENGRAGKGCTRNRSKRL